MRRVLWTCALLIGMLGIVGWGGGANKRIADYDNVTADMNKLVLLPPSFTLEKAGMFTADTQTQMAHDISLWIHDSVEQLIIESRYKLADLDFSDSALTVDPELRRRLGENASALDVSYGKIAETKGEVIDVAFPGDLDYLADRTDSDYLLMVAGSGYFKSGGTRTMEALLLGGNAGAGSATQMQAMLVDATRGKVLWYNEVFEENKDPRKPSQLMKTAQALLQPVLGKSKLKADNSHDADIIMKYKLLEKLPAEK